MLRAYPAADTAAPALLLAHGAGAGQDHAWMIRVAEGLAARGVQVVTFDFPYIRRGRRLPDRGPVLEASFVETWSEFCRQVPAATRRLAGGKSMGGRIASQVVAGGRLDPVPAGLIFFGYPLHPPGKPDARRDSHLSAIDCPMRFVQGTRDPFATPAEMEILVGTLRRATLQLVSDGDHSLATPRRRDPDAGALALALDEAAAWLRGV